MPENFDLNEVASIYVSPKEERNERFIVSLIVGYGPDDRVETAEAAVRSAIGLATDMDNAGTLWHVFDRLTGQMLQVRQGDAEAYADLDEAEVDADEGDNQPDLSSPEGELAPETVIPVGTGFLRCPAYPAECSYVRVTGADGEDVAYWDQQEWRDEPAEVMGALLGCLKGAADVDAELEAAAASEAFDVHHLVQGHLKLIEDLKNWIMEVIPLGGTTRPQTELVTRALTALAEGQAFLYPAPPGAGLVVRVPIKLWQDLLAIEDLHDYQGELPAKDDHVLRVVSDGMDPRHPNTKIELELCSGQSNYWLQGSVWRDGQVVYEEEAVFDIAAGEDEMDGVPYLVIDTTEQPNA